VIDAVIYFDINKKITLAVKFTMENLDSTDTDSETPL
jgi:hypothetical protein